MKKIMTLAVCLTAFNAYAQELATNQPTEETLIINCEQLTNQDDKQSLDTADNQETISVTVQNAEGHIETVPAKIITLKQATELLNSNKNSEYLAEQGVTPDQAIETIVQMFNQIKNDERTTDACGVVFTINSDTPYFIKASEFEMINNDLQTSIVESEENSDINN